MEYLTIQPPFTLRFREMSKAELAGYLRWLVEESPRRIAALQGAVTSTSGFEDWQGDGTPASLSRLGAWFARQVETRPRSAVELTEIAGKFDFPIPIPDHELSHRTFSLAMDVGLYLADVLMESHENIVWKQFTDDRKFADYGQPVLIGFGVVPLNPIRIAINLAYGLVAKKQTGERLIGLYNYWSGLADINK
jgi:hypothetical protein